MPQWKEGVKAHLKARGWEQKDLADKIRAKPSSVSEALSTSGKQSSLVPAIHTALGWDQPPVPVAPPLSTDATVAVATTQGDPVPLPSPDATELAGMYDRLPPEVARSLFDQAAAMTRALDGKARRSNDRRKRQRRRANPDTVEKSNPDRRDT